MNRREMKEIVTVVWNGISVKMTREEAIAIIKKLAEARGWKWQCVQHT